MPQVNLEPIEALLGRLWEVGGTDLHLVAGSPPRLRVDGELIAAPDHGVLSEQDLESLVEHLLPERLVQELIEHQQVDFSFSWRDQTRFRGNAYRQRGAVSIALRAIPYQIPTPDDLLLPPALTALTQQRQGLILMTGPTGAGKSTTQAAMIGVINRTQQRHILTLEDPIEYVHHHDRAIVSQREIGADVDTFEHGLRAALREDPDVVLVGEMRDPESIATTLTVAETGHLVLATLHTNDTSSALDRIIDVFPAERQGQVRVQLAASLTAVVAQRLIPRTDGGLIAAFEILLATSPVRNLIREGKTHQIRNVIAQNVRLGMQTLEQSLSTLLAHRLITPADALANALVPAEVRMSAEERATVGV